MKLIGISLLSLLALPLAAQDSGFSVNGGVIWAPSTYFGSYEKAVNNNSGYYVGGSYTTGASEAGVVGRGTVSYYAMPGQARANGLKTSLDLVQIAGDVVFPMGVEGLDGVVGFSANIYSVTNSGTESADKNDVYNHFPVKNGSGLKGGVRIGVEYAITKSLKAEVMLQQTELGGQNSSDPVKRVGGVNPGWMQIGLRYNF
ncbi:MAG TPA: hypothetical protein PKL14_05380 [Holophaga sp.]|nr:hypothetical protein [Holophaga sp.]